MWSKFRERWESEESSLGKKIKYYIGYVFIGASAITLHVPEITAIFMNAGVQVPVWLPKVFLVCGILGYVGGKITKRSDGCKEGEGKG